MFLTLAFLREMPNTLAETKQKLTKISEGRDETIMMISRIGCNSDNDANEDNNGDGGNELFRNIGLGAHGPKLEISINCSVHYITITILFTSSDLQLLHMCV